MSTAWCHTCYTCQTPAAWIADLGALPAYLYCAEQLNNLTFYGYRVQREGIMHAWVTWTEYKLLPDADRWMVSSVQLTFHLQIACLLANSICIMTCNFLLKMVVRGAATCCILMQATRVCLHGPCRDLISGQALTCGVCLVAVLCTFSQWRPQLWHASCATLAGPIANKSAS